MNSQGETSKYGSCPTQTQFLVKTRFKFNSQNENEKNPFISMCLYRSLKFGLSKKEWATPHSHNTCLYRSS